MSKDTEMSEPIREMSPTSGGQSVAPTIIVSSRRAVIRAYRGEMVFAIALSAYAILAVLAHHYDYFGWDISIGRRIQSVDLPGFAGLMSWISVLGNGWVPFAIVIGVGVVLSACRLRTEAFVCLVGVAAGSGLNRLSKLLVARPRPAEPLLQIVFPVPHESFPSGHVVFFVEFFGFLFFLTFVLLRVGAIRRTLLVFFGVLIGIIGISRVFLGAHWPSDVFGAYLAGGIWLMMMIEVYRRLKSRVTSNE
jgi:undecaprenyl-diphosphatase